MIIYKQGKAFSFANFKGGVSDPFVSLLVLVAKF